MVTDVIIVGSGPSGVSAAVPLVEAGLNVTLLDQGREANTQWHHDGTLMDMRLTSDDQWRPFLGEDFVGLGGGTSKRETPKLKVPAHRYVHEGFLDANRIRAEGVAPTGSLAKGGVSLMWGAGAFCYDDHDLTDFPISAGELLPSYRAVAGRIGISGVADDAMGAVMGADVPLQEPLALHGAAAAVLQRYESKRRPNAGFKLGRTRNAVITEDLGERPACRLDNKCMWGCPHGSIYSADQDVQALSASANFRYVSGALVERFTATEDGYRVFCRDVDGQLPNRTFDAAKVVLAAGTVATTALVLRSLHAQDEVPFGCHPAFAMAFVVPQRIGRRWSDRGFALGHLAYRAAGLDATDYAFGVVFPMEGVMASDLIQHMPLSRRGGVKLAQLLVPSFLVANGYLHSRYASGSMRLAADGTALVRGAHTADFEPAKRRFAARIAREFLRLGAIKMPLSAKTAQLGSDGHFVGTLPMRNNPGRLETSVHGELHGMAGLYIADGAALPSMSAKHPTFTFMANADRIGRALAASFRSPR